MKPFAALVASALVAATGALAQAPVPEAYMRPDKGHCIACHALPAALSRPGGDAGPALNGSRMRELGAAKVRQLIEDPMQANPNTVMPPYGRHRILEAGEIDSLVRFLQSLPDGEPAYAQPAARDANAEQAQRERGRALWTRKFKDKRSLSGCFPNGGQRTATSYPQYDARVKRLVTLETAINQCLKVHHEALLGPLDADMGAVVAYVRSLAAGQKIAIRVPPAAKPRVDEGRRLYFTRMGQRNFACASCHVQSAGKRYEGSVLTAAALQATKSAGLHEGRALTLQARMRECLVRMGAAPFAAGSDELNHLEYYLTVLSNAQALETNAR